MKTNVVMKREMGDFIVFQRTKDGMFNATLLLKQWNEHSGQKKQMNHFTSIKSTQEFIEALKEEGSIKQRNHVLIQRKGKNGGTWMHPFLFIDFAMWINPTFKLQVIKFVYDQLILYRHKAGDNYRSLASSAAVFPDVNYPHLAKALNWIVFNRHEKGIRQVATPEELKELQLLEEQLAFAIDAGYIKTFDNLISDMRKLYHKKHDKF